MIAYNFALINLNNKLLLMGGHTPEITNTYIKNHYKKFYIENKTFEATRYKGISQNKFISNNHCNKAHINGVYIINLTENKQISYYKNQNKPVIHLKSPHINTEQNIDFDTMSSLVFNKKTKKYIYCTRANIKSNTRFISYSSSNDMINWETFKYLDLKTDFDKDNYYYPSIFNYYDIFIGFPLYSIINNNIFSNSEIKVIVSDSEFNNWQNIGYLKKNNNIFDSRIVGVNFNNKEYDEIFEHTNQSYSTNSIISHKFPKYSIFGIKNNDNLEGEITTKPIVLNQKNILHANILENGYINIEFLNEKYTFSSKNPKPYIFNCEQLNTQINIKITFKHAALFSINCL